MNIFAVSNDPVECAQALDNRRLVKMVLETAQILCTAIPSISSIQAPYRATHRHHPVVIWAAQSNANTSFTVRLFYALCDEYTHRYGKTHKCYTVCNDYFQLIQLTTDQPKSFVNCCSARGLDYKHIPDTHEAYRQYLAAKWTQLDPNPQWSNRGKPVWFKV